MKIEEDVKMGKENQLYTREFRYVNPGCRCMTEKFFDNPDRIKVQWSENVSKKHKFIFVPGGEGLVEEGKEQSADRVPRKKVSIISPMTELWELGEYNGSYTERLKNYIDKYGFFWPISKNTENIFYSYDLFLIINRLRKLHELFDILALGQVDSKKCGSPNDSNTQDSYYIRLFNLTFFFVFSAHVILDYKCNREIFCIETCSYDYGDAWWFPRDVRLKSYDIDKSAEEINREDGDKIFYPPSDNALRERHHWIKQNFRDRLEPSKWATNEVGFPYNFSGKYTDEISEAIEFLYRAIPLENKEGRHIADFLYRFIQRVAKIEMISPDGTIKLESVKAFSDPIKFSECMKTDLINIARMVYRKELNWKVQLIAPRYGEDSSYEWEIPSYLSALYFAQFLTTKNDLELRKCAKPDCSCYFLVDRLNSKFKYHSSDCENAMSSQRNRDKKRKNLTE